ncbi:hypothetical protein EYZ49_16610 [Salmonella enterica subsp. salamae serovar 13,22:z:-]|uniref:hypothetical protein n=1 Tax=Salmonella enterica TaxID=28901 RepID=UPI0010348338|nr:hypothetical protein [Salmonella enterica]TBN97253.1 hypothetical protein EYZ49_16610 [Salmonella enterica subsp. salamae serovar 13,22:z:-]
MRITGLACLLATVMMTSCSAIGAFIVRSSPLNGPFTGDMGVYVDYGGTTFILGPTFPSTEIINSTKKAYGQKVLFYSNCNAFRPDMIADVSIMNDDDIIYRDQVLLGRGRVDYLTPVVVPSGEIRTRLSLRVVNQPSDNWYCNIEVGVQGQHYIRLRPERQVDATVTIPPTVNLTTTDGTWAASVPVKGVMNNGSVITISAVSEPGKEIYLGRKGDLTPLPAMTTVLNTGTTTGAVSYSFNADLWGKVRNHGVTSYLVTITVSPS